jgi:hypothetical protein
VIDPFGRCADALEVHASYPPGREIRLPASRTDADETGIKTNVEAALRSHYRMAERARALGMTQREYKAARKAGAIPQAHMQRHPRSDKGGDRA